jgi:mono/diheme cytochrome c family protein
MRPPLIAMILAAVSLIVASIPAAGQETVALKQAPGLDTVEQNCAACHSLDYIVMNSPIQDQNGWTATVTKMINVLGAPIDKADAERIVEYLSANYGKK